jgi:hypothetical protein
MRASDKGSTERPVLKQRIKIATTTVTNQRVLLVIFLFVPIVKTYWFLWSVADQESGAAPI